MKTKKETERLSVPMVLFQDSRAQQMAANVSLFVSNSTSRHILSPLKPRPAPYNSRRLHSSFPYPIEGGVRRRTTVITDRSISIQHDRRAFVLILCLELFCSLPDKAKRFDLARKSSSSKWRDHCR